MEHRSAFDLPSPTLLHAGSWVCAAHIPWLPDLVPLDQVTTAARTLLSEAFARQITMLHAIAAAAPKGSAVQLRFVTGGADVASSHRTTITIVVRAHTANAAAELMRLLAVTLPPEFPLQGVLPEDVAATLAPFPFSGAALDQVVEIRREAESLDTFVTAMGSLDGDVPRPIVLPWTPSFDALSGLLGLLATSPDPCVLCVHLEPARPSAPLISHLESTVQEIVAVGAIDQNPLAATALRAYRTALRELPRAALRMRVSLAGPAEVAPGLAEGVAVDLTRAWEPGAGAGVACAFRVLRPRDRNDHDRAAGVFTRLEALPWRLHPSPEVAEMIELVDVVQAAAAFRLPVSVQGGVPGVATTRLSSLPTSPELERDVTGRQLHLGLAPNRAPVTIGEHELNRHLIIGGLPGFGKTTTTHRLLSEAHRADIPFLVIDPAKSDYERFMRKIAVQGGGPVRIIDITPGDVAMNPLAVPSGADPAAHAQRVLAAFDSALSLSGHWPMGYMLLGRAIFEAYRRAAARSTVPTLRSLYAVTAELLDDASFSGETAANLRAGLLGRLEFLADGPLGQVLTGSAETAIDWADLLASPALIMLRRIPGAQERSLVFALLVAGLVSYRDPRPASRLCHLTVLEEAHRLLPAETGEPNEGVRATVQALAELRGFGEGFVIVDQAPSTLAAGVTKLCGSMLTHRLVETAERESIGSTMVLDSQQQVDLARLPQGRALLFSSSRDAAVLCDVEPVSPPSDSEVLPDLPIVSLATGARREAMYCVGCPEPCRNEESGRRLRVQLKDAWTGSVTDLTTTALATADGHAPTARCAIAGLLGGWFADRPGDLRRTLGNIDRALNARGKAS